MEEKETGKLNLEFSKLDAKRQIFFSEVQELYDLSRKSMDSAGRKEFLVRTSTLDETIRKIEELTDQIVDVELRLNPKKKANYQVLKTVATLRHEILLVQRELPVEIPSTGTRVQYKLPDIQLPEFSGQLVEWPLFYKKFSDIVDENPELDDLSKLHYLLGCLKGKAREICAGITPTPSNYRVILNLLVTKFNNERQLADMYVTQMLDIKALTQESASDLSKLALNFDAAYSSLKDLKIPDLMDYFAVTLILRKLDPQTRREFETSKHEKIPKYGEIRNFLHSHIEALQQVSKPRNSPFNTPKSFLTQFQETAEPTENKQVPSCPRCRGSHLLYKCETFMALSPIDRQKFVNDKQLCQNCLSAQHKFSLCKSQRSCKICHLKHHSLLHGSNLDDNSVTDISPKFCALNQQESIVNTTVLLSTAVVFVETPNGFHKARFLLDSASQCHFITAECCRRLGLNFQARNSPVTGIGTAVITALGETEFTIHSRINSQATWKIRALVVNEVTDRLPSNPICRDHCHHLDTIPLADEHYYFPGQVDGILGAEIFGSVVGFKKISGLPNTPVALETLLGYVVMGSATSCPDKTETQLKPPHPQVCCVFDDTSLAAALQRFWELEEVPNSPQLTEDDQKCETLFTQTTLRSREGRYCVHLPFKEWPPILGESWSTANRRFRTLERRFAKSPELRITYSNVIQDYLHQGHLTEVSDAGMGHPPSIYIPHFGVFKESSSTPLRVVFDASAKTSNGRALNDVLFTGPKLQKDIFEILLTFRFFPIAITADIRQMYRNIMVTPDHRRFQRILWRESPSDPLKTYELNCVVFGLTSAPFLALRTIQQLAKDEGHRFTVASSLITDGMYVDDLVISMDSLPEANIALDELVTLFRAGGFKLTKWATNSLKLRDKIPAEDLLQAPVSFNDTSNINDSIKVLGLNWTSTTDVFSFQVNFPQPIFTKRGILSTIARIWDPLGFLAPVNLLAKALVKELWSQRVDWDDEIPSTIHQKWNIFHTELGELQKLQVPRHIGYTKNASTVLVGFSDSSERGYGAVVYSVVGDSKATTTVRLLCAKSKVTPLKICSLPRLELCAALLLAKLMNLCSTSLRAKVNLVASHAFTDSSVVLHWVTQESFRWKTFVANRVAKIQELTPETHWSHIRSEQNPADVVSRGQTPGQLVRNIAWVQGPPWLSAPMTEWPASRDVPDTSPEASVERKVFVIATDTPGVQVEFETFLKRFSSWTKLLNVTIHMLKFTRRLPRGSDVQIHPHDMEYAEHFLIRRAQNLYFPEDIKLLNNAQLCTAGLRPLAPFIHNDLLRVGGRLCHTDLDFRSKHPILIPKQSHLAILLIDHFHRSNLHTGPNLVLALIRQKFWIPSSRNLVRKRIRLCNICFKTKPRPAYPPMADLPAFRVLEAKPFLHTGVDYAGPVSITLSRHRGVKSQKAYVCLFVCLATKAVHLELASDLTSERFLACLQRFLARRGPVTCLYSDRGTNFIGARAQLDRVYKWLESSEYLSRLRDFLNAKRINWKFNPPHAPHFGGIWEGNIKAAKTHLLKTIGKQILSYEELSTVLAQVEALLNSRPLCTLSTDASEAEALTPAHFLTLMPLQELPLTPFKNTSTFRQRKELLDSIIRCFWKRWRLDYLSSLQPRRKWTSPIAPLTVGTVVVVREENSPPLHWPLGVVEEVFPGTDGVIRVAAVRVGRTIYQRPTVKLYPLPTQ